MLGRSGSGSDGAAGGGGARDGGNDLTAEADASDGPAVTLISAIRRRETTSLACAAPRCMSQAFCSLIVRAFSSAMRVPGCKFAGASMMCARGSADGAGRFLWAARSTMLTSHTRFAIRSPATLALYGNLMKRPNAALYSGNESPTPTAYALVHCLPPGAYFSRSSTW